MPTRSASRSTASTKLRLSILRMKSITSPPSAQAPKQYQIAAGRGDLKARSLFVVEGTQALHRSAGAAQSDVGADHFLDASPIAYGGDVFLVDPAPHAEEFMFRS